MTEILLIKCPYCNQEWIHEDSDLVCEKCKPKVDIDLAVAKMHESIEVLEQYHSCDLINRKTILSRLVARLNLLLQNVE